MGREPPVDVARKIVENDSREAPRQPPSEFCNTLGKRIEQSTFGTLVKPGHTNSFLVGRGIRPVRG